MKKKETEKIIFPNEYYIVAADLSLKRPGFCVLKVNKEDAEAKIKIKKLFSIDNKNDRKKCHSELLDDIHVGFIKKVFPFRPNTFFIREAGIMHTMTPAERNLAKVIGIMDLTVWKAVQKEWYEIYPTTVKKLITGSGKAEKEEVAQALQKYVGKQEYKCDDESDALAVGLAWLIQQGELKEIV